MLLKSSQTLDEIYIVNLIKPNQTDQEKYKILETLYYNMQNQYTVESNMILYLSLCPGG